METEPEWVYNVTSTSSIIRGRVPRDMERDECVVAGRDLERGGRGELDPGNAGGDSG